MVTKIQVSCESEHPDLRKEKEWKKKKTPPYAFHSTNLPLNVLRTTPPTKKFYLRRNFDPVYPGTLNKPNITYLHSVSENKGFTKNVL